MRQFNEKSVTSTIADLTATSDASKVAWGASCGKVSTEGFWNKEESEIHITILELTAAEFALQTCCKDKQDLHVHLHLDSTSVLSYIAKMGRTKSLGLFLAAKHLWELCLENNKILTVDYLPGVLNKVSD